MSAVAVRIAAATTVAARDASSSRRALRIASWAERVAEMAEHSLLLEVSTFPKPGLVSDVDNGSHTDMDAPMFRHRSAAFAAIRPFFRELVVAGVRNCRDGDLAPDRPARREEPCLWRRGGSTRIAGRSSAWVFCVPPRVCAQAVMPM